MSELVFLLEERSAEELLKGMLPLILPKEFQFRCIAFEGKQDLEKQLVRRIRGYLRPDARFIVMRDQDSGDCRLIKAALVDKCRQAGRNDSLVRIVCRELESWYLADLEAVEKGLEVKGLSKKQAKAKFRDPDNFSSPYKTLIELASAYQKISGSRAIGPFMDLNNTRSSSFSALISGIRRIIAEELEKGSALDRQQSN